MARVKVTVVTHAYLAEENRKKLALLGREAEVEVVSPDRARTPLFRYRIEPPVIQQDGYIIRFFRPLPERGIPARYVLWSRDLGLRRFRPDAVHVEGEPWTLVAQQALWCARRHVPRAAVVCTVRQHTYTAYGALTGLKDWLARRAIARVDRFLAGNTGSRQVLLQRFGVPPGKIELNPQLGVDTDHFRPATPEERRERRRRWGLSDEVVVVGYCGRLVEEKGLLDLCQAVQAAQRRPGARLQLALLGDGPLRPRLEAVAGENVVLHRVVPHGEVASFLQALDIFVLPTVAISDKRSTLELDAHALQEAMACGVASIGTESGPIPEILSGAGVLVPPSAPAALSEAIVQLLDADKRRHWGDAGRQRVRERYSNQRVVEKQLETYARAIEERRRRK
ncbi:MAG: glycosyltransferase family 4 protein [Candidatus Acidiferrales bacterium]